MECRLINPETFPSGLDQEVLCTWIEHVKFAPDIPIENHWQHHSSSKLQYRDVMSEQVFQYKPEGSREIKRPNKRWIKQITGT